LAYQGGFVKARILMFKPEGIAKVRGLPWDAEAGKQ
jgi:hypothetical protein